MPTEEDWNQIKADIKKLVEAVQSLVRQTQPTETECDRERGKIPGGFPNGDPCYLEEKRISIFALLSSYRDFQDAEYPPAFYSVVILSGLEFNGNIDREWNSEWRTGLEGTIVFHAAVWASVKLWKTQWDDVLDKIDECVRVRLRHTLDPEEMNMWMFDKTEFERSKLYVTTLQILRIFSEYIRTVLDDLRVLDGSFLKDDHFPMPDMRPNELRIMRSNWKSVRE
ncbi:hypothetical protein F5Y03DRAFT_402955 [Xylaria venustula]|nr:hypothetical protein F5Y03DRAFT_402955 [Xylaria venustula]